MHISADVCGGRKSLVKPVTWYNISSFSVLSPEIVMHDDAYISGRSENNIKCVVHDDLWWKNRTTLYILPRHWLYEWFFQFHRCGTYIVLSRSPSADNNNNQICIVPYGHNLRGTDGINLLTRRALSRVQGSSPHPGSRSLSNQTLGSCWSQKVSTQKISLKSIN